MATAEKSAKWRPFAMWELGMLGNHSMERGKIHEFLQTYLHDPDDKTRYWTVESLAHLGTVEAIPDFLDVFRNDPSPEVRNRAACSLARSGMLRRAERWEAVPGLIEMAEDPLADSMTHDRVYQVLREITDEHIGDDPGTWRHWYSTMGAKRWEELQQREDW
jgi:hypothetical protein